MSIDFNSALSGLAWSACGGALIGYCAVPPIEIWDIGAFAIAFAMVVMGILLCGEATEEDRQEG